MAIFHELLKPDQRVFVAGSSNEPTALLKQLSSLDLPQNLEFLQFPLAGFNDTDFTTFNDTARLTTFFMTGALKSADQSRLQFLPMQLRTVYDYLSNDIDVALVQVAHDKSGVLRLGPNIDFASAALGSAKVVIAELNKGIVAPAGCPEISVTCFMQGPKLRKRKA